MITRRIQPHLTRLLDEFPAVALLGPRQVGKTTLATELAQTRPSVYLDLQRPSDLAKVADPELYLADHRDELVIFDEVHRLPDLFQSLRGEIDRGRRRGQRSGRFLLLGSASIDLLRQSGESLAGRIAFVELAPLDVLEVEDLDRLWLRGGFPDGFSARSEPTSVRWRESFVRTYLQRDVPELGPSIPAETLRRFWTMLAHQQGGLLNAASLARGLGVSSPTVAKYVDLLVDLLLVRRLEPWHANTRKRLVKSPRIYLRDTGICHTLLGIPEKEALLAHPVVGPSWEAFVIENLIRVAGAEASANFYRSSGGAEIDLILELGSERWAIEVKRSMTPKPERGFHSAVEDVEPTRQFVVYPGTDRYRITQAVEAIGLTDLARELASASG